MPSNGARILAAGVTRAINIFKGHGKGETGASVMRKRIAKTNVVRIDDRVTRRARKRP